MSHLIKTVLYLLCCIADMSCFCFVVQTVKQSKHVERKVAERAKGRVLDPALDDAFSSGRLLACISSRPGQSGRCDGYILEGAELDFYSKQLKKKKGAK